jgi:isopropylmalate/homocitrate/citramalate synthase
MFDHFAPPPLAPPAPLGTLLDVTLRDGGFEVDFSWPAEMLAQLPAALSPVGADIVELGYLGGVPREHGVGRPGVGAFLQPEHLAAAADSGARLAAMVHPAALDAEIDLRAYAAAGLSLLRLVYHPAWLGTLRRLAGRARDQGLAVSANIALASRYQRDELLRHAEHVNATVGPDILYLADTCGAMLPSQVTDLITSFREATGTPVGFHAHDFLSLAYANALAASAAGATYLDVSVLGMGRGGGNLQAELVLVRHRLPGRKTTTGLTSFLRSRAALAALARRTAAALLPAVCGALNLTPVEEQEIVAFAESGGHDLDLVALWLACGPGTSLRADGLRSAWRQEPGT